MWLIDDETKIHKQLLRYTLLEAPYYICSDIKAHAMSSEKKANVRDKPYFRHAVIQSHSSSELCETPF